MKTRYASAAAFCALIVWAVFPATGQLIDFETTPAGGIPVDDAALAAPYNLTGGGTVIFFFDVNLNNTFDGPVTDSLPVFELAGNADPNAGFTNTVTGIPDTANGGLSAQLGSYFLRQLQPGAPPPPFIIDYNTATSISALHGEIWDIDGTVSDTEQWRVEILDSANNVLTFQDSPLGDSSAGDGLPWDFVFSGLPAGVDKARITFNGTKTSGLGLAFNNFNPFDVPEPGTMLLAGLGIAAVLGGRTSRRR